jgi:hypothetical protein
VLRDNSRPSRDTSAPWPRRPGAIDVSFNAIGIPQQGVQGIPLVELSPENFTLPIMTYTRTQFLTARADVEALSRSLAAELGRGAYASSACGRTQSQRRQRFERCSVFTPRLPT